MADINLSSLIGPQPMTLTGDVTGSGTGSFATTIGSGVVTLAKMANLATNSLIGRSTAGSGVPEVITIGSGLTLSAGTLSATGGGGGGSVTSVTMTVPTGLSISGSPITTSGTLAVTYTAGYQGYTTTEASKLSGIAANANNYSHPNHSGDVTSTGDGATVIASGVVSLAKMSNLAANSIIGNNTGSAATPLALTAAQVRTLLNVADGATANAGTVTAVSVATANGVSGSSSGGATPALTIALGAITPTSVAASGTVTGSNLSGTHTGTSSGTNTGDQTTITGNAGTATTLQTSRTIAISGKATGTATSFNGSANITIPITAVTLAAGDIPALPWSQITSGKPTTLAGYGISDGASTDGATFTGTVNLTANPDLRMQWNTGAEKWIYWTQNGLSLAKWRMGVATNGNFTMIAFDGSGNYAATPLSITAGTANWTIGGSLVANQSFTSSTATAILAATGTGTVYFRPNGVASSTGQVYVDSAGRVWGAGVFSSYNTSVVVSTTGAGTVYLRPNGEGSTTGQLQLASTGIATAADFSATSDARLKIVRGPLEVGPRLAPKRYTWKDSKRDDFGFVAQEVEEHYPECVTTDGEGFKAISYGKLTAVLAAQLNETNDRLAALEEKMAALLEKM